MNPAGWWFRAAGFLLAAIPFLPVARLFDGGRTYSFLVSPGEWLLGVSLFGVVAWLAAAGPWISEQRLERAISSLGRLFLGWGGPLALVGLVLILTGVSFGVFSGRPLLVDSVAQLFQARIFAAGAVTAPAPPLPEFFHAQHLIVDNGGWYAQYPPGHAALLAVGVFFGAPWVMPILLTLGTAWFLYRFADLAYGRQTATLTLLLTLLCPFVWFMGASFMNHVSSLFFISLVLWLLAWWERDRKGVCLVGAGAALGAAFLSRPLTALAVGLALGAVILPRVLDRRALGAVGGALLAGAGVSSLYLLFNAATTGDPFVPGYVALWGDAHGLGFHATPWGDVHSPLVGLRNQLLDLSLLALHTFEWPIPALLPVGILFLMGTAAPWDRRLLVAFLAVPAAYFFYWHRDAYLGPRFLYATLAFLLPLTARALQEIWRRSPSLDRSGRGLLRPNARAFVLVLVVGCFAYALAYGAPRRYQVYASGMSSMKVDLTRDAREAGIEEGLVFVAVSWGNRLLTGLRAAGADAGLVERAYRTTDHCSLHQLLQRAGERGWSPDRVVRELREMRGAGGSLIRTTALNGDRTLRLDPERPLAPSCRDEIRYDRGGYTVYTPHLLSNRPDLSGSLVVARDLREQNARLRALYPERAAYLYREGRFELLSPPGRADGSSP